MDDQVSCEWCDHALYIWHMLQPDICVTQFNAIDWCSIIEAPHSRVTIANGSMYNPIDMIDVDIGILGFIHEVENISKCTKYC